MSCLEVNIDNRATIEELEFSNYIKKLQHSNKNLNIQVSQVEEFFVNTFDSKVSTDVPVITTERKNLYPKKSIELHPDFCANLRGDVNESYNKTDRYLQNKFNSFDVKVNSPKESNQHSKKEITYENDIKRGVRQRRAN